jgi:tRNA(Ile)-lysidine synthase
MATVETFLKKVKEFISQENLIKNRDRILVGVSGGMDSTVLLHLLRKFSTNFHLTLLAVHINYHLRGEESDENEKFVKWLCKEWGIPLVRHSVSILEKSNLENTARIERFRTFRNLIRKYQFDKIAVGHTKTDQAETLLYHLFRGTGISGMKGMLPMRDNIIRPLLCVTREEIESFTKSNSIPFSEDSSNFSLAFDRNKIRHLILPVIEQEFGTQSIEKIAESGEILRFTDQLLRKHTEQTFGRLVRKIDSDSLMVSIDDLIEEGGDLFYFFRKMFYELTGSEQGLFSVHFHELLALLKTQESTYIHLPDNVFAIKNGSMLIFSKSPPRSTYKEQSRKIYNTYQHITFGNYYISLSKMKSVPAGSYDFSKKNTCYIAFEKVTFPLTIRYRKPGDRFVPLGMHQAKKLKEFFIDEKIPRYERDKILMVEDQSQIIWVAGLRISENVKITPSTQQVLRIKVTEKLPDYRPARRIQDKVDKK